MQILPLAPAPFTAPTDRDMLPSERREFVRTHRTCVFGYARRSDGPAHVDRLLRADRRRRAPDLDDGRAREGEGGGAQRDRSASASSTSAGPSPTCRSTATRGVERDPALVVDVMMAVAGRMSGQPLPEQARPVVQAMAEKEGRVVLRCRPYETFAQPPRHLHRNDQAGDDHPLDHGRGPVGRGRRTSLREPTGRGGRI